MWEHTQEAMDALDHTNKDLARRFPRRGSRCREMRTVFQSWCGRMKRIWTICCEARGRRERAQLIDELRNRVGSFDTQISETVQAGNPALGAGHRGFAEFESGSAETSLTELETENWTRVESDHKEARRLIRQAEWALSIVSAITLLFSVWVSLILPRQVVKPLISLREAVDHAAQGQ